jgi:hypothetical protein
MGTFEWSISTSWSRINPQDCISQQKCPLNDPTLWQDLKSL